MQRSADAFAASQAARLTQTNDAVRTLSERLLGAHREAREEQRTALEAVARSQSERLRETNEAVGTLSGRLLAAQREARDEQRVTLEGVTATLGQLTQSSEARQEALRQTVAGGLETLRADNAEKLERMRATVDEKLQGTLERRLGKSFQLVSDRLEQVHKGLGEMQTLATGVGDLKRVLSNVKSRGGWGEVQLGMILGDILTAEQFEANAKINPERDDMVEYAIRLPGRSDDNKPILLPIDAKFPSEDYERLVIAQEAGLADDMEKAGQAVERAIRLQAKTIGEKYIHPPHSTDFAIMYLPTEGLFAEVIRRPGLASELQTKHRVLIQGPDDAGRAGEQPADGLQDAGDREAVERGLAGARRRQGRVREIRPGLGQAGQAARDGQTHRGRGRPSHARRHAAVEGRRDARRARAPRSGRRRTRGGGCRDSGVGISPMTVARTAGLSWRRSSVPERVSINGEDPMSSPEELLRQLTARLPLADVVARRTALRRVGQYLRGSCPFCQDREAACSFYVYERSLPLLFVWCSRGPRELPDAHQGHRHGECDPGNRLRQRASKCPKTLLPEFRTVVRRWADPV